VATVNEMVLNHKLVSQCTRYHTRRDGGLKCLREEYRDPVFKISPKDRRGLRITRHVGSYFALQKKPLITWRIWQPSAADKKSKVGLCSPEITALHSGQQITYRVDIAATSRISFQRRRLMTSAFVMTCVCIALSCTLHT